VAATTATVLIERFASQRIVFTGVAGGAGDGVQVGDVVVAHDYVQHDMDASPCSSALEVPGYPVCAWPAMRNFGAAGAGSALLPDHRRHFCTRAQRAVRPARTRA
jgi:adenosylhomocysteine nucleosidase